MADKNCYSHEVSFEKFFCSTLFVNKLLNISLKKKLKKNFEKFNTTNGKIKFSKRNIFVRKIIFQID